MLALGLVISAVSPHPDTLPPRRRELLHLGSSRLRPDRTGTGQGRSRVHPPKLLYKNSLVRHSMSTAAKPSSLSVIRRWRRSIVALVLLLPIGLAAGCYAAKLGQGIVRGPNQGKQIDFGADPTTAELAALGVDRQLRVDVGPPAASLSVWIVDPQPPLVPRATVFVIHGINDSKDHQLARARRLVGEGYRAVVPDLRSHGRSTGDHLTYGVIESNDMKQLADALDHQGLIAGPLAVWGHSYEERRPSSGPPRTSG